MAYGEPAYQDELLQRRLKSLYICETKGCGVIHENKTIHCRDCQKAEDRKLIEDEWRQNHKQF